VPSIQSGPPLPPAGNVTLTLALASEFETTVKPKPSGVV
jgi:hypothetical protein